MGYRQGLDRVQPLPPHAERQGGTALRCHHRQAAWSTTMDQETLVGEMIDAGKQLLERLVAEGVPVAAGFWVKETETGRWYLYIATPLVPEDGGTLEAYGRINAVRRQMPESFGLGRFQVRAVSPSSPVGEAVVDL